MAREGNVINNQAQTPSGTMTDRARATKLDMSAYGRRVRMNKAEHLVTKGIEDAFAKHPLYSQDGKGENADILVKYFNPYGRGRWYVLEANPIDGGKDYELYGIVDMGEGREYGYFRMSDLQGYIHRMGNYPVGGIERDLYFGKKKVKDIKNDY